MKQYLPTIIAVLAAINLALFSIETVDNPHSGRSGRTYSYNPAPNAWNGMQSVVQGDSAGSVIVPLTEVAATTESLSTMPAEGSPLSAPPALLEASAMAELTPVQLPPLDAGMVNVTGVANDELRMRDEESEGENQRVAGGYRIAVPVAGSEYRIALPYDPSLLPQGFTEEDIQTYVYDRQHHRWAAIQRDSVNEAELLVCSRFRPWEKGLPHTQNDLANPQDALAQVQDMMSFAPQGEGGGDSPLDFINAVLKTPEMPETSAYTPTSIKELKAADPLEGLTLIQPPTANNSGTANLSYPIEIPAGRQGMQPSLALTYSSGGGNGWLGVGWDISIPSITVETRWGVPRYSSDWESETYLLNGEQLTTKDTNGFYEPLSHQAVWKRRYDDGKQFYPRVEGAFQRIIRHGTTPKNYWWEIQDKQGVTYYYGRRTGQGSPDQETVLTDNCGNIAQWMLTEVRDLNGNYVKYVYQTVTENAGRNSPKNIYPKEILYTLHDSLSCYYSVNFILRENEYNPGNNGRYGFLQTNSHLLEAIVTEYHKPDGRFNRIKAYTFCYQEGMYGKALLQSIGRIVFSTYEIDPERPLEEDFSCNSPRNLTTHTFEYYDDSDIGDLFGPENDIYGGYDTRTERLLLPYTVKTTPLGGSSSDGWSVGGALTVGFGYNPAQKGLTVGGNYMYSENESKGVASLTDIDGDGLPDILFSDKDGFLYYSRMQPEPDGFSFQSARPISTDGEVSNILFSKDKSHDWGLEAHATIYGVGASAAYSHSGSTSSTTTYLSDIDADGLPDIVSDGVVYYNRTNLQNGGADFQSEIYDTIMVGGSCWHKVVLQDEEVDENMFLPGDTVVTVWYQRIDSLDNDGKVVSFHYVECRDTFITEARIEEAPDFDPVRVWIAPYSGEVSLSSHVCLTENLQFARFASHITDGVRASVQMNDGTGRGFHKSKTLLPDTSESFQEPSCWYLDTILHVQKGDRFYFRTESIEKRLYDKVVWDPTFEYHEIDGIEGPLDATLTDADGKFIFRFSAKGDYLVDADRKYHIALDSISTIKIESDFSINSGLSDAVTLHIFHNNTDVCAPLEYPAGSVVQNDSFSLFLQVSKGDSLYFVVESPTNVRWEDLDWKLRYYYTAVSDTGIAVWDMHSQYPDTVPVLLFDNLIPHLTAFPRPVLPTNAFLAPEDITLQDFPIHIDIPFATALFSVKTDDGPQYQETLVFDQLGDAWISENFQIASGEIYYLDLYSDDPFLLSEVQDAYIAYGENIRIGLHIAHPDSMLIFGPLYQDWGQFAYRKSAPAETMIVQDSLHISQAMQAPYDPASVNSSSTSDTLTLAELLEAMDSLCYDPANDHFQMMEPDYRARRWLGYGNLGFFSKDTAGNTYSSDPDTLDVTAFPVPKIAGRAATVVNKLTETKNNSVNACVQIPVEVDYGNMGIPLGGSYHWGYTNTLSEYMDMNGDGYPDIVTDKQVQYTKPQGGLSHLKAGFQTRGKGESFETTAFDGFGASAGGSFTHSAPLPSNNTRKMQHTLGGSAGVNCSLGSSNDRTEAIWADINGDGLPDRVFDDGTVIFNTGYTYSQCNPAIRINAQREGRSSSQGLTQSSDMLNWNAFPPSGKVNLFETSIAGGTSFQHVGNRSHSLLADLNGDGLPDKVGVGSSGLSVWFNTGYGFGDDYDLSFNNHEELNLSHSYSRDLNVAVSFGFSVGCFPVKFVINPQFCYNWKVNVNKSMFADINGDGLPDYVRTENENHLLVRYNQSGKANLLKSVTNLAGGSMTMGYELSKYMGYDSPTRIQVLDSLAVYDGLQGDGADVTVCTFEYDSAYYDRYERTSYGFGIVKTHFLDNGGSIYRTVTEKFSNRHYRFKGLKNYELLADHNGNKYVEKYFSYVPKEIATGVVVNDETAFCFGENYPALDREETRYYEGTEDARIVTRKHYEHGPFGNLVKYTDAGQAGVAGDSVIVTMTYHPDSLGLNLTGMVDRVETRDGTGNLLREKDCNVNHHTGQILSLRQYNDNDTAVTDFAYDTFGNLIQVTGPANSQNQRVAYRYSYDSSLHIYPVMVKNVPFGYVSTTVYDLRIGKPLSTTDINGNVMTYVYDWDGRLVQLTAPADTGYTLKLEYWITYGDTVRKGANPWARTRHYDIQHADNPMNTTIISDGLGRIIQTRKDAEIMGEELSLVTGTSEYDCFGRVTAQYFPFTDTALFRTSYQFGYASGVASITTYDVLGRQKHIVRHHGVTTDMSYGFSQTGGNWYFSMTETDGMGNTVTVLTDTRGYQVRQTAPDNTATSFSYDALGQLTSSTDPMNLTTTYTYDKFGQITERVHPDAGTDSYEYDAAGNMVSHTNGNNRTIQYRYDHNRLTDVEYPDHPANNVHYTYGDSTAGYNGKGRIVMQEDGTGWQTFKYGTLGEITENSRTLTTPFEQRAYTFKTKFSYDSWNRIDSMTYPDGEVVHYKYNRGGMLNKVYGIVTRNIWEMVEPLRIQGGGTAPEGILGGGGVAPVDPPGPVEPQTITFHYPYIDSIIYNIFELKDSVVYGNGTRVRYEYDSLQRLSRLRSYAASDSKMQDISYTYDPVGNITHISNAASGVNGLGGCHEATYTYDNLYRLTAANGFWNNGRDSLPFSETMVYAANGRILKKTVNARVSRDNVLSTKRHDYRYSYADGNRFSSIDDRTQQSSPYSFQWDLCGNLVRWLMPHSSGKPNPRVHTWTEDNRLRTVADRDYFSYYQYDASGERTCKLTWSGNWSSINGTGAVYYLPEGATLYASPYLVITPQGYTKHYYAETERITSQLGKGQFADVGTPVVSDSLVQVKLQAVTSDVGYPSNLTEPDSGTFAYLDTLTDQQNATSTLYFYHPDHLGSSSWITDRVGAAVQHLHYLPWGEDFVDQRLTGWAAPYTFSAKERDAETGLSYFGSRYYSSDLSIWLSVDPQAAKYPSLSPYVYCADNPVKLVDPNGEEIGWVEKADGTIYWDENAHNQKTTKKGDTYLGEEGQRSVGTTVLNYHSDGTYNEQETVLIVDWGEDISTEYVRNNKTFKEREADFTNKSADFLQGLYIFLVSPINDLVVLTTSHDLYGNQVTKEDKTWSAIGIATFGSGKTLKILRLSDKVKKTKKIERGVEAVGTGLDIKTGRETYKKNNKRRNNHEKK